MMTNETFFFRDKMPFEHFRATIMPALLAARRGSRTIRIWCAAASTGQEPYSLAMCLKEMEREIDGWHIEIFATDLSNEVLEKARARRLQPVRGAARAADPVSDQIFRQGRRGVADRPRHPRDGEIPAAQSADAVFLSRQLRSDLLPQRADLFRPGHQGRAAGAPVARHRRRRLSGARRRGNRRRPDRQLQDDARQTRPVRAQPAPGAAGGARASPARGWSRSMAGGERGQYATVALQPTKTPAVSAGFFQFRAIAAKIYAEIFASSSAGSRST